MGSEYDTVNVPLGCQYVYAHPYPKGYAGELYYAHRMVQDVPSYQDKVLVEGLTGRDTGRWFTCSLNYFLTRFKLPESPPKVDMPQGKIIDLGEKAPPNGGNPT